MQDNFETSKPSPPKYRNSARNECTYFEIPPLALKMKKCVSDSNKHPESTQDKIACPWCPDCHPRVKWPFTEN